MKKGTETIDARHAAAACDGVAAALDRLKIDRLYGVLVHQVHDLAKPGWQHLVQALQECRARGWVTRIGASVYDEGELALVGGRFSPDLIQLPFNALDRRLCASGALDRIAAQGTEVHARSVFLQGLILMEPGEIPSHFAALRGQLTELHASWEARGLSPLAGCLRFVLQRRGISVAVVGVNQSSELEEIFAVVEHMADPHDIAATHAIRAADTLAATAGAPAVTPDSGAAIDAIDARYVDPRKWSGT